MLWVVYRKECFLGGIVALTITMRCFKGVLGDQGCVSTPFWTKFGFQTKMNALVAI